MKKTKFTNRRSPAKSKTARPKPTPKTVPAYFAATPQPARATLEKLGTIIRSAVPPESTETISYAIPAFRDEKVLIWYAAFANHVSLFPTASIIESFKSDLKPYTISKGTIQFRLVKPLPTALIKKIVKARVAQTRSK